MLRVCNPTKATSPLVLADLPVLCLPHYRRVVDIIEEYGCGYVYRGWRDLDELLDDRARWPTLIAGARRERCVTNRKPSASSASIARCTPNGSEQGARNETARWENPATTWKLKGEATDRYARNGFHRTPS
jgi:hypothetical protein